LENVKNPTKKSFVDDLTTKVCN